MESQKTRDFGLVFETHIPETVRLPHLSARRGVKVSFRDVEDKSMFEVVEVDGTNAVLRRVRHAEGSFVTLDDENDLLEGSLEDLVVANLGV